MRQVKQYALLQHSTVSELSNEVNLFLRDGWELYGQPFGFERNGYGYYCQAVAKYEQDGKNP